MMKTMLPLVSLVALASGCSVGFDRAAMTTVMDAQNRVFTDDEDVLRIEQLKPQIEYPIRLAVVPPPRDSYRCGIRNRLTEEGETELLRALGEKLKKEGIVSDFIIVPEMLLRTGVDPGPAAYLKSIRIAAARLQADAVLILRSVTDIDSYINPLGILDVTVAGLFLVPGHQKDALTVVEGMVIDNRNQYLYFVASGEGKGSTVGPAAVIGEREVVLESRRAALEAFGNSLLEEARLAKTASRGSRNPSNDPK